MMSRKTNAERKEAEPDQTCEFQIWKKVKYGPGNGTKDREQKLYFIILFHLTQCSDFGGKMAAILSEKNLRTKAAKEKIPSISYFSP